MDFLADDAPHAVYFIAPLRFGKTFNNMLEMFLAAEIVENYSNFSEEIKEIEG